MAIDYDKLKQNKTNKRIINGSRLSVRSTKEITKQQEEKEWWEEIFQTGAFDDGYDFGDISKTILGTAGDIGLTALKGVTRVGEGIGDTGAYVGAQVLDWLGADNYADQVRDAASESLSDKIFGGAQEWLDNYSIIGNTGESAVEMAGYSLGLMAGGNALSGLTKTATAGSMANGLSANLGNIGVTVGGHTLNIPTLAFVGGMSGNMGEAYQKENVTDTQAWVNGLGGGIIEGITEGLFGWFGVGGSSLDDAISKGVTDRLKSGIAKTLANVGIHATGEAVEEFLSYAGNQGLDYLIDKASKDDNAKFYEDWDWNAVGEEMVVAFLSAGLSQGGSSVINNTIQSNNAINVAEQELGRKLTNSEKSSIRDQVRRALIDENTLNEQKVIDNLVEQYQTNNQNITKKELVNYRNEVTENLRNGNLNIKDIENVLGDISSNWVNIQNQINELQEKYDNTQDTSERTTISKQIESLQNELAQDGRLQRSYYETSQRYTNYAYEINENDSSIVKLVKESASKIMNNATRTRDLVENVSKIAEATNTFYEFTNNEQLSQQGYNLEGKNVDGLIIRDGKVLINIDSPNALNRIIGHETTHLLENTDEYQELQDMAIEYAKTKGEYDSRLKAISELYKGMNANIYNELTSDLVGDYIFDTKFIENLANQKPTLFRKIYNYVKHISNLMKAGSKEARQLENLRYKFQKAYLENVKNSSRNNVQATNEAKYSIKTTKNGIKYIDVDTNQDVFNGINPKNYNKIAKMYINDYLQGDTTLSESDNVIIDSTGARKYTNPGKRQSNFTEKMKLAPELKNVLEISKKINEKPKNKTTAQYDNYEYYEFQFKIDNQSFSGIVNVGIDSNGNKHFYEINNIKKTSGISETSPNRPTGFSDNNISQNTENVKSLSNKYSITELSEDILQDINEYKLGAKSSYETIKASRFKEILEAVGIKVPKAFDKVEAINLDGGVSFYSGTSKQQMSTVFNTIRDFNNIINQNNKYSLSSTDNQGRVLTKEQQEYFKDSKVRNENGNLLVMYHGTKANFNIFDMNKAGQNYENNWLRNGKGFYFTSDYNEAYEHSNSSVEGNYKTVKETYLNVKKPFYGYENYVNELSVLKDKYNIDDFSLKKGYRLIRALNQNGYNSTEILQDLGYDGIIEEYNGEIEDVVVFNSNQIKNIDNATPTLNEDIRYSLSKAETEKVVSDAKKEFGITTNFNEAGYMTPDGKLLDFSGKKYDSSWANSRSMDHREINSIDVEMQEFIDMGNIRVQPENNSFELALEPTEAQYNTLRDYIDSINEEQGKIYLENNKILIDINKANNLYDSAEYDIGTSPSKIISDLKAYFETGQFPAQSDISQFRYSLSKNSDIAPIQNKVFYKKSEINEEIRRLNSLIYHENEYTQEQKEEFKNQIRELKELKRNFDDIKPIEKPYYKLEASEYENYKLTDDDMSEVYGIVDRITRAVNDTGSYEEMFIDDEIHYVPIIKQLREEEVDFDLYQYNIYEKINNVIDNELAKEGISLRYDEKKSEYVYDRQELAIKGYNELLDFLNQKEVNYEISRSTEAGHVPSIYIKNADGDTIFRIANHDNGYIDDFAKIYNDTYNKLFDDRDYANWKDNIVPVLEERGVFDNSEYSLSRNDNIAPTSGNNIYGKDVKIQIEEAIAPLTEEINKLQKAIEQNQELDEQFNDKVEKNELGYIPRDPTRASSYEDVELDIAPFADMIPSSSTNNTNPLPTKDKFRTLKDAYELLVNRNAEIDRLAKDSGNQNIKFAGDMLNSAYGEADGNINVVQTDSQGNIVGESLSNLFQKSKSEGYYEVLDDYLKHYSNIDRTAQQKGSTIPAAYSSQMIAAYDNLHPYLKTDAEKIWAYGDNMLKDMANNGLITQELYNQLRERYPHYVPYIEDVEYTPYMADNGEVKPLQVVKTAQGGAKYSRLLDIENALTKYTYAYKRAIRQNELYQEIVKTLSLNGDEAQIGADTRIDATDLKENLYRDETGNYLTAYIDGKQKSVRISDELYRELSHDLENTVRELEERFEKITKPLQKVSQVRRNLLTSWNPTFILTNAIKDIQDATFNSKYSVDMLKNYPGAFKELFDAKTDDAKTFLAMYGSGNLMGEFAIDSIASDSKLANAKIFRNIAKLNNVVELAPRFAEFKASRQNGASIQEALYNAREITTNFGRGGVITKALNRNGATFLNASVQGFDKFIRNFSGQNGAKGVANALLKVVMLGVVPALFNDLVLGDDEDYEALPDYIKDNYYLLKTSDGKFVRIPKGRMLSVFGSAARRTLELVQGEEDAFDGFLNNAMDQIGPNNPFEENIFSPLIQAANNETWYGGDIVSSRLQDLPEAEQYDESTDALSIFLGGLLNISPAKINYVLDQYSGGIGDVILPLMTEEATNDGSILAPLTDKFVVNSTTDNKYVSDIYTLSDELLKKSNSSKATDEDVLKNKYISSITGEMGKLYSEIRKVQNSDLSKKEKYAKVQVIKDQINSLAEEGLNNYESLSKRDKYAIINDREYYKYYNETQDKEVWTSPDEEELEDLNSMGMDIDEKNSYFKSKVEISKIRNNAKKTDEESEITKVKVAQVVLDVDLTNDQKYYLYDKYYGNSDTLNVLSNLDVDANEFIKYDMQVFEADKNAYGDTISGSRKNKVFNYINSMNITFEQKVILAKLEYNSYDDYNHEIIDYLNKSKISYEEEVYILKALGFKVYDDGSIEWE